MRRERLVERVYRYLLTRLAARQVPVGTHLNAQRIADELGISRTSANGAIARLVADGWARPNDGRRPVVVELPPRRPAREVDGFHFRNQTEQTYEAILDRILRGELRQGETFKERRLAVDLAVNPVTVHRACEWLRNDGLLERLRRRGWQVVKLRLGDLRDIYRVRMLLEPRAVRRAARHIGEETIDELSAEAERIIELGEDASVDERRRADYEFHCTLIQHCGSRILRDTLEPLIRRALLITTVGFRYSRVVRSFREHQRVLEALRRRDGAAAARHLVAHLREALDTNVQLWCRSADGDTAPAASARLLRSSRADDTRRRSDKN